MSKKEKKYRYGGKPESEAKRGRKQIADAELTGKRTTETTAGNISVNYLDAEDYPVLEGEKDAAPLEFTEEEEKRLLEKSEKDEEDKQKARKITQHYVNGVNEWKLISKTWNEYLGTEHVTMAMDLGNGVLVSYKEAHHNSISTTLVYIPNAVLERIIGGEHDGKYKLTV